ncbi:MAG: helix-turn-helix domain-containing protein [Lachnospiraceae bacterium]|nr:helix-turn-helix domain-containing protein [Lachnospiraceae bacterium]
MDYTVRVTKQQYARIPLVLRMLGLDHMQEVVNRPAGFPVWQILYGVRGSGSLRISESRYILQEGQIAMLPPHLRHSYKSRGGEWVVHFLGFGGNSCQKLLSDLKLAEHGVYHLDSGGKGGRLYVSHLEECERVITGGAVSKQQLLSKELYSMLLDLSASSKPERTAVWNDPDGLVTEVMGYLEQHLSEDLALGQIAEEFHLTPEYLCARFKGSTGDTIGGYLKRIRIGRARMLLMERPELTLAQAGELCGYRSPSYFGKVFKEETGMTPQTFKTLH